MSSTAHDVALVTHRTAVVPGATAWLFVTAVACMLAYYFIGFEQGASAVFDGAFVHEFTHDARHFLGFPCH